MGQTVNTQGNQSRAHALARRKALSGSGKAALQSESACNVGSSQPRMKELSQLKPKSTFSSSAVKVASSVAGRNVGSSSREASLARRRAMSTKGKSGVQSSDRTRMMEKELSKKPATDSAPVKPEVNGCSCAQKSTNNVDRTAGVDSNSVTSRLSRSLLAAKPKKIVRSNSCRAGALARRKALSARGKAGISKSGMSLAQAARASNPELSSRELARTVRDQKSRKGSAGQKKAESPRRMRPARNAKPDNGAADDAHWKVGASTTVKGQILTGTMVDRIDSVTGVEASACRDITGTEYMGGDVFKHFCQTEPAQTTNSSYFDSKDLGGAVTGNQLVSNTKVTGGDKPGASKSVTGVEYVGADATAKFSGSSSRTKKPNTTAKAVTGSSVGRSGKMTGDETGANRELTGTQYTRPDQISMAHNAAPAKVEHSNTLSGGTVTGSMIGRKSSMTGDESGSCRNITGDEYLGMEQFESYCNSVPEKTDSKVGRSNTFKGENVTGTMVGRSQKVTGDEPGTCKSVTGTPYAGLEQYQGYCDTRETDNVVSRMRKLPSSAGSTLTGIQPSVGGNMTGDSKGACEMVSGTPYLGLEQQTEACPAVAAEPNNPDFPQLLENAIGHEFSVSSPSKMTQEDQAVAPGVTGSSYDLGTITGPFGMATGKVTGTSDARHSHNSTVKPSSLSAQEKLENAVVSRVTGEGISTANKITGDDWDRGDRITGTEGVSSIKRNPSFKAQVPNKVLPKQKSSNRDVSPPISRVTGGSGNTENGSLITYSGGARG